MAQLQQGVTPISHPVTELIGLAFARDLVEHYDGMFLENAHLPISRRGLSRPKELAALQPNLASSFDADEVAYACLSSPPDG